MSQILILSRRRLAPSRKLVLTILLTGFADWLFFGWDPGISVILFFLALSSAAVLAHPVHARSRHIYLACGVLAVSLLPMIEGFGFLSLAFGLAGVLFFILTISGAWPHIGRSTGLLLLHIFVQMPLRLLPELSREMKTGKKRLQKNWLFGWLVTLALCFVFGGLLAAGNPLIADFLNQATGMWGGARSFNPGRLLFWLVFLTAIWSVVGFSVWRYRKLRPLRSVAAIHSAGESMADNIASGQTVFRCLVLFNLLFAIQTGLDLWYLWGGAELPHGMTYAEYAHRGAYPLLATALLAACLVLVAMRHGGPGEDSALIRLLLYVWVFQNILLVLSSILRLDLYVEVYSLTMVRMAAFIWMGLVVFGLALIIVSIALRRGNSWLLRMNSYALIGTLYFCCFINFPALIAGFNFQSSQTACESCSGFDFNYAVRLGEQAFPVIDTFLSEYSGKVEACYRDVGDDPEANYTGWQLCEGKRKHYVKMVDRRNRVADGYIGRIRNWRDWTYSDRRAMAYLDGNARLVATDFTNER